MKSLAFHASMLGCADTEQVFEYFMNTLKPSLVDWPYFVNWTKVEESIAKIEVALNILNSLVGKAGEEFDSHFKMLVARYPEVRAVLPALAVRTLGATSQFSILVDYSSRKLVYKDYDFGKSNPTSKDVAEYLEFIEKVGLKRMMESRLIGNLVDYMTGVEAGLDSNARKNRVGETMQRVVRPFVADMCGGRRFIEQATPPQIKDTFGRVLPAGKASRIYDFAVEAKGRLYVLEVNFYGGGGSKLKATAGEYIGLHEALTGSCQFIWVTDGPGWKATWRPLRHAMDNMDYVFNLDMLEKGVLRTLG